MITANLKQPLNKKNSRTSCNLSTEKKKIPEIRTEKNHKTHNIVYKVNKPGLNVKRHNKKLGDVLYIGYKRSDFIKRKK